jgi:hypothetical protein
MSFLDDIIDFGTSVIGDVVDFVRSDSIGAQLAKAALAGVAVSKLNNTLNKPNDVDNTPYVDPGVRLQINPNPEYSVPVVYGTAVLGGVITDAQLTNNNQTMHFCITICEQTGSINLGQGAISNFIFKEIYWNDNKLSFDTDGITVTGYTDKSGNFVNDINGLMRVYCYNGDSNSPVVPEGYTNNSLSNAINVMPNWTNAHNMTDLIFVIVRLDYNADKGVKSLGNFKFKINNDLYQPGDVLYDYMTNARYGASINPAEIYVQ